MLANILTTLVVAGAALAAPAPAPASEDKNTATCTSKATKVTEWTVADFDFHSSYTFSTPAHQNSWGYVSFTLVNPVLGYKAKCSAASSQLEDFFYGTVDYKCDVPAAGDSVSFSFARPTNELHLEQTWNCASEGSRFTAKGGARLNLTCSERAWVNPDWKQGELFSTRNIDCEHVTVKAPVTEISGVA